MKLTTLEKILLEIIALGLVFSAGWFGRGAVDTADTSEPVALLAEASATEAATPTPTAQTETQTAAAPVTVIVETGGTTATAEEETAAAATADTSPAEPATETQTEDENQAAASTPAGSDSGLIDINSADLAALETLPGIGEVLAGRIIEYRETNGPFSSIEEIVNVSGIGDKKYEAIKNMIEVRE